MNEPAKLAKNRRLHRLYVVTLLVGVLGMLASVGLTAVIYDRIALWLGAGFAAVFTFSAVVGIFVNHEMYATEAEDGAPSILGNNYFGRDSGGVFRPGLVIVGLGLIVLFVIGALQ
jgi:hypothetical protein